MPTRVRDCHRLEHATIDLIHGVRLLLLGRISRPSSVDFHTVDVSAEIWFVSREQFVKTSTFVFPSDEAMESIGIQLSLE